MGASTVMVLACCDFLHAWCIIRGFGGAGGAGGEDKEFFEPPP
ncbi:hypothetical protein [Kamptonema formosum]|nr:hypothetical protein [Oscillatoria sp. PCC 10802]